MTPQPHHISPEELQFYLDKAARIRSQTFADVFARLFGRRRRQQTATAALVTRTDVVAAAAHNENRPFSKAA